MVLKKGKGLIALVACLLLASPAMATITVSFSPPAQNVPLAAGTTTVDILADIPAADAIVGWGFDLTLGGALNITESSIAIGPMFDAAPSVDLDGYSALVPFTSAPVSGSGILLATVTFTLDALGTTSLTLSDNSPADVTEGFARDDVPPDFADVTYNSGAITVVPEPASLALVALGGLTLLRRRR